MVDLAGNVGLNRAVASLEIYPFTIGLCTFQLTCNYEISAGLHSIFSSLYREMNISSETTIGLRRLSFQVAIPHDGPERRLTDNITVFLIAS